MTKSTSNWKIVVTPLTPTGIDTRTVMQARGEAEQALRLGHQIVEPVSGQIAQVYDRGISRKMVESLVLLYARTRNDRREFVASKELGTRGGDYGKLRHWGLTLQKMEPRKGKLNGRPPLVRKPFWQISEKGIAFCEDNIEVPKRVLVYCDRRVGYVDVGTATFDSLMGGVDLQIILSRKGLL